jgi:4-diphosphocytidyl-2C-methyl-D-erythritol kinase
MSGSGSAVFGLFPEAAGAAAARRLRRPDWLVLPTRTLARRDAVRRIGL